MKRILVIADNHAGHLFGLCLKQFKPPIESPWFSKVIEWQEKTAPWFKKEIDKVRPFDALIWNGDALDGKGERSGGTELLTSDRIDQIQIAKDIYEFINPPTAHMIYGTPYHSGREEDWERVLARELGIDIGSHSWIECEGVTIDFKHKVSGSVIPHGRRTGPERARLWNRLWAERSLQPKADLIVRSHIHYYGYSGDADGAVITTPCLQGFTKYGAKECEGTTDFGFITIDCEGGNFTWTAHLMDLKFSAAKAVKL
ncbi:MAG: hypothetical protein PHX80_04180 [Candidatus Nanoarchaeia archaeon]|nr:hypothetical protein [Candidatus Nanoarchaeia archaeon]